MNPTHLTRVHFNGLVADVKFKGWVMRCCFIRVWANRIVHLEINEVDGFEWMVHNYDSFLRVTNSR